MTQIKIQSTDPNDTQVDIEDKLVKAAESVRIQREKREFSDDFLRKEKESAGTAVTKVFNHMLDEIVGVLGADKE